MTEPNQTKPFRTFNMLSRIVSGIVIVGMCADFIAMALGLVSASGMLVAALVAGALNLIAFDLSKKALSDNQGDSS